MLPAARRAAGGQPSETTEERLVETIRILCGVSGWLKKGLMRWGPVSACPDRAAASPSSNSSSRRVHAHVGNPGTVEQGFSSTP